jgi:hypothetical protein
LWLNWGRVAASLFSLEVIMKRFGFVVLWLFVFSTAAFAQQAIPAAPGISPIGSPTYVNAGSLSADVLNFVVAVTLPIVSAVVTGWIVRLFQMVGVNMTDAQRARLQEMVVNGIHAGTAQAESALQGAPPIAVKNQAIAHAVEYVQQHGQDTLKALGLNPNDPAAVQAIQARVLSAIANPAIPTPPVLNTLPQPPNPPPPA